MQTFNNRVAEKAKTLIAEEVISLTETLTGPSAATLADMELRRLINYIHGLRRASEFIDEAETAIQKETT